MAQYGGSGAYANTGLAPGIGSIPAASVAGGVDSAAKAPEGQGWGDVFSSLFRDPGKLAFMLALGNSLSQRRPGQGPMNQLSEGVMRGFGMMGLMAQMRQQQELQQKEIGFKERAAANDEKRTAIAGETAAAEGKYRQDTLGIERSKLAQEGDAQKRQDDIMLKRLGIDAAQYANSRASQDKQLAVLMAQAKNQEDKNRIDTYGQMLKGVDNQMKGIDASDMSPTEKQAAVRDVMLNAQKMGNMLIPGLVPPVMTGDQANAAANPGAAAAVERARGTARTDAANNLALSSPEGTGGGTPTPTGGVAPAVQGPAIPAGPIAPEGPVVSQGPVTGAGSQPQTQAPLELAKQIAMDPTARPEHVQAAIQALSPYLAQNPTDAQATQALSQLMLKQQAMGIQ